MPKEATVEDIANAYRYGWEKGLKSMAIYRDGSKDWQVLNVGTPSSSKTDETKDEKVELMLRPEKLTGCTYKVKTPVGTAFVVINSDDLGNPFEVFINVGKAGTHVMADAEAIGRLLSTTLRIPSALSAKAIAEAMIEQLAGILEPCDYACVQFCGIWIFFPLQV